MESPWEGFKSGEFYHESGMDESSKTRRLEDSTTRRLRLEDAV